MDMFKVLSAITVLCLLILYIFDAMEYKNVNGYLKQENSKWMFNSLGKIYESDEKFPLVIKEYNVVYSLSEGVFQDQIIRKLKAPQHGLIIYAFRGQDKSSLIRNFLCSSKSSELYHLCSKIMFYHMCTIDDDQSRNPYTFIKQFAIEIMKRFPKIGQSMYLDAKVRDYLYGTLCPKNPRECLNYVVIEPLKKYKKIVGHKKHLLVVEFFDDCYQTGDDLNWNIHLIIEIFIEQLPNQFKIILISRQFKIIFDKLNSLSIQNLFNRGLALIAEGRYIKNIGLSIGKHHDVIGVCKDDTEIMLIFIFLYCVTSIKTELRTDQCMFLIFFCCCFIKKVTVCCVLLLSPTLLVISYIRMMTSSNSKTEESVCKNWFYQLNMTCDNIHIHCIIDKRLERKYKYLQSFYAKNERLDHILDSNITRSQNQRQQDVMSEFERIYSNKSSQHCRDRLFMQNVLLEASANKFYVLMRWVLAHKQEHAMTVADMKGVLDIAIEKRDTNIAKAIAWCITREFFLEFAKNLINAIDIYPGIRCLCQGSMVLDNPFCTNRKVIIILTRIPISESPDTYHGFEIEEVNPDLSNSEDSEAVTISNLLSTKYTHSYFLKVNLSQNTVENIFNCHSNVTLICPSVLKSKSFNKVHAIQEKICIHFYCKKKGILPLGEDHFPSLINGVPTDIIDGNLSMITKLRIGDKIGPQTSIGTLGGFVQYLDFDCFLTRAHVMYDFQTLLSSSYDFSRLPGAKAFCHSTQGLVDCGKVIWRTFDHDDKLKTSIDAALVLMQNNANFDPNDFILDGYGNACPFVKLGLSSPFLNTNCLDHEEFCILQQTANVVAAGAMTKLEASVTFPKQSEVDILFSNAGQASSFYNGNVFQPLWINSPAHMQLGTGFLTDKRIFRMYNQITINLGLQPGDSGTCIYVVKHPYNKTGCIGMAIAFCGGMTVVTPLKDILKRISSS